MTDLAAAYLVRAERTHDVRDLLEALESADRAVTLQPRSPAARYNLALALDRLLLDDEAASAWRHYLHFDSTSGWAREARERLRELGSRPDPPVRPAVGAPPAELSGYAERARQNARAWGWDEVLGQWGAAVLAGDGARAEDRLRSARALGEGLARGGGDATLADAVTRIRSSGGDPAAVRSLARAHRAFSDGRAAYKRGAIQAAREDFAVASALARSSPPLRQWARWGEAVAYIHELREPEAIRILHGLEPGVDSVRHPALAASTRLALGTALLREGRYEQARDAYRASIPRFERAGERESVGQARYLVADAEFALGAWSASYAAMYDALATLRPYRRSVALHNVLSVLAEQVASDGLARAAVYVQSEGMAVAGRRGESAYLGEALAWRAQFLLAAGDSGRAQVDLRSAREYVRQLPPGQQRNWLGADLQLAGAALSAGRARAAAAATLDSAVSTFAEGNPLGLLRALVARAQARLALGDAPGATSDLHRAAVLLDEQRDAVATASFRASLLDAARGVFDRLVLLRLAAADTAGALDYLDRARASFSSAAHRSAGPGPAARPGPGEAALVYALVGDTLLIWTVAGGALHLERAGVDRGALLGAVEHLRASLQARTDTGVVRRELAALYDRLLRPVRERLGTGTNLVLVADGELADVPFAALYDARRRRYVIQDHSLRFAPTLRDAARPGRRRPAAPGGALLVADPAFDPRRHPLLGRLAAARAEVRAIASEYPRPQVLEGRDATRERIASSLRGSGVFHFAGHAVFDDERPERSYLVLAPGAAGDDRLTAAEIEGMDFSGVRLVMLSACETLRAHGGHSGGFAGFAGAVMAAGAGGVVGSLWLVEDRPAGELATRFHAAYRRDGDGAAALRAAQLGMLASPDPSFSSPAAWAGFRYAGN
ncbi:MAG: CHAT domain-containing protein [Longimicrobiaceae bacterium]